MSEKFLTSEVAAINHLQLLRESGGEKFYVCPFCGNKKGKFSINDRKNFFHCWSCDAGGGATSLHMMLNPSEGYDGPDGVKKAAKDIWKLLKNEGYIEHDLPQVSTEPEVSKQSDEDLSRVYKRMLSMLTLQEKHKNNLLKRGISEDMVRKLKFKSVPDYKEAARVVAALLKEGYELEGVPGFYMSENGTWKMKLSGEGIFCPVYDGDYNYILGFQIRLDNPLHDNKYIWFAGEKKGGFKGCSIGSIASYLPGKSDGCCIITEGILKAAVTWCLLDGQVSVLGVPGVKCLKTAEPYLLRNKGFYHAAFDMDKASKKDLKKSEDISNCEKKLIGYVNSFGCPCESLTWDTDKDGMSKERYKGIDDFLVAYDNKPVFIRYIVNKAEKYNKINKFFA